MVTTLITTQCVFGLKFLVKLFSSDLKNLRRSQLGLLRPGTWATRKHGQGCTLGVQSDN